MNKHVSCILYQNKKLIQTSLKISKETYKRYQYKNKRNLKRDISIKNGWLYYQWFSAQNDIKNWNLKQLTIGKKKESKYNLDMRLCT